MKMRARFIPWGVALLIPAASGCAVLGHRRGAGDANRTPHAVSRRTGDGGFMLRPVVGVESLENRAGFGGAWPLGEGLSEMLEIRLVESGRVTVVEQRKTGGTVPGLARQAREWFRPSARASSGRPLQARYRVYGAVTEFSHPRDASGWFRAEPAGSRLRRARPRAGLLLSVADTETGEIIGTVRAEGRARSARAYAAYPEVPFGGGAFFRTPLGRATDQALREAVRKLLETLPVETWEPRVAEGGSETAIVNGGLHIGLREGMEFLIRAEGRRITDPRTGEPIDTRPGSFKGRLRITDVRPAAATALIIEGSASRGDLLVPVLP